MNNIEEYNRARTESEPLFKELANSVWNSPFDNVCICSDEQDKK